MRRAVPLLLLAALSPGDAPRPVDGDAILAHVRWLADDARGGRGAGSEGERAAGDYAARHFEALGLAPIGDDRTYFQNFPLPQGFTVRRDTCVVATRGSKRTVLEYPGDLKPLTLSAPGDVTAPALFAGYGIAAPDLGYDDYEGIDAKGKVVIVLRHAPAYDDRESPFFRPDVRRAHAVFEAKVRAATGAGAAALLVVNDPEHFGDAKDDVALQDVGGAPGVIPVLHLTWRAGHELARACGIDLRREQAAIDRERKPRSRVLEEAALRVNASLEAKRLSVRNVCALLAAPSPQATGAERGSPPPPRNVETLVVGAHLDHVGLGAYGSLAGSKGKGAIHNGADDNASGAASLFEIASFLAARREALRRDVLFLLFTAEELGLIGSKHYVERPLVPLERCVAMVNLDMVGRLERGRLQIGGTGTSPVFPELLEEKSRAHGVRVKFNPGGRAPTDSSSFYEKGLPVLFFFTGLHADYHRPTDDWQKIDRKGIERVARLAAEVCLDLATRPDRPPFSPSDASGFDSGPYLGLSLEQRPDGVYVNFVEERSPASKAGVEVGDKLEEFEGQPVPSVTAFHQIHQTSKPRSAVTMKFRRGPRLVAKRVTLGD